MKKSVHQIEPCYGNRNKKGSCTLSSTKGHFKTAARQNLNAAGGQDNSESFEPYFPTALNIYLEAELAAHRSLCLLF